MTIKKKTGAHAGHAFVTAGAARQARKFFLMSASALVLTALSAGSASAQWTGATSADWTDPTNWTGGVVPTNPTQVTISPASGNPAVLGVNGAAAGSSGNILVGLSGVGNLTIQNGSTLTSSGTFLNIGRNAGSNGTVTVTGAGSHWTTSTSALVVGLSGTGTLNILNGGTVTAQNGITFGSQAAGSGTLNIGNGGVLETTVLNGGLGTRALNFDGGTVRALASNVNFMNSASTLGAGGLTLDTNGFTIGVRDIGGAGGVTITGGGTVQLANGTNSYTGETWIQAGSTLRPTFGTISSSSRVIVDGTFNLTGASVNTGTIQSLAGSGTVTTLAARNLILTNASDTFFGNITGGGNVRVTGGTQTFGATQSYTGGTLVSGTGTLRAGAANVFATGSAFTAQAGGTFDLNGFDQTIASLDNAGTVRLGGPGTTLTVTGNYIGNGGTVQLNTVLGGDGSATDRLVVQGDTSGSSTLRVTNVGGTGAQTVADIKLVDVQGASNGTFALQGNYSLQGQQAVVGGAYAYMLHQGSMAAPGDGDWYLRSQLINPPAGAPAGPVYQAGVPLYEAYPQVLLGLNGLSTMSQRVGDRYNNDANAFASAGAPVNNGADAGMQAWWGRMEGWRGHIEPRNSTAGTTSDTDQARIQTGLDGQLAENAAGRLMTSLYLQYGTAQAKVRSFFGDGTIKAQSYSIAGALTWLANNGFYVDTQAQATFFDTTLYSATAGYNVVNNDDPKGYALGLEAGWKLPMGGAWSLTPQAQLVYSKVDFDFADVFGVPVLLDKGDSLQGRGGLAAEYQSAWIDPSRGMVNTSVYGIANLYYEFLDGTAANVAGVSFANAADRLWGGIGGGGSYAWANGKYALYTEALVTTSLDNFSDSYGYKGTAGFKMKW